MNTSTAVVVRGWGEFKNHSPTEYYTSDPKHFAATLLAELKTVNPLSNTE